MDMKPRLVKVSEVKVSAPRKPFEFPKYGSLGWLPGIYRSSYGTMVNVITPYLVWDTKYRRETDVNYLLPGRVRKARWNEYPDYYADSGRDEVIIRKVWRDSTGKVQPRKI